MPQVSVIVPVYKVEPYIHRCVDSILAQTYTGFELILVDDGSPDNCGAICDEYAAKDVRIHVIHQENGGLSAARNAGIDWAFAHSDSEWIAFVDSDDWVHPQYLEYLERAVREQHTKVSACRFEKVEKYDPAKDELFASESLAWDEYYLEDTVSGAVAWNKLYAKELFRGQRYPVGKCHEDEFLTYKLLYKAGNVAYVPLTLYMYYQNPEGIMKRPFSLSRLDAIDALGEQCSFARKIGNRAFFDSRAANRVVRAHSYIGLIEESDSLSESEKKTAIRKLRGVMRSILIRDGKNLFPIKKCDWIYGRAFPKLNYAYWVCIGVIGKIKRMVK